MRHVVLRELAYCVALAIIVSAVSQVTQAAAYHLSNGPGSASGAMDGPFNVAYAEPGTPQQMLDVYAPTEGQRLPVVVWIHGGGWRRGDKSDVDQKPQAFVDRGFVFISINYRLFPDVTIQQIAAGRELLDSLPAPEKKDDMGEVKPRPEEELSPLVKKAIELADAVDKAAISGKDGAALEQETCNAFDLLGFDAEVIGGPGDVVGAGVV